jgi:DNA-binding winged helix-turn-helix (wHTH) protein
MNRRKVWVLVLYLGLVLLAVGAIVVMRNVNQFRSVERHAFRESCRLRTVAFEEHAEHGIIRKQLDSLEASAQMLLLGDGMYIDVVAQGEMLLSDRDEGQRAIQPIPDNGDASLGRTLVVDLPNGDIEVRTPIILTGYPDSPFGDIRIGFSGDYANSKIRAHMLRTAGLGLSCWVAAMAIVTVAMWMLQRRGGSGPEDNPILCCGTLLVDTLACRVSLDGAMLELTPKLYELLLMFIRHEGEILSDQDLLDAVWTGSAYAASPDVKQHIYLLRRALGEGHPDPKCVIVNVKGFGYRLDPPTNEFDLKAD